MALHSLPAGKQLVGMISRLGKSMGYLVREEWPVQSNNKAGAAVDVAWFAEENQKFPLMIFEIETSASAGMVNNAAKVFSKSAEELEKPLFYFHLILSASPDNERVASLRALFGTHNYRIYILNKSDQLSAFVSDLLTQHRRIRAGLNLEIVLTDLMSEIWQGIDIDFVLSTIEKLDFKVPYLQVYAGKAASSKTIKDHFVDFLKDRLLQTRTAAAPQLEYEMPFFGQHYVYPIHLGILASVNPTSAEECFGLMKYWQLESSYMSQIGPHFGLSQDYDEFVVGYAPSLWAVLAALFKHSPKAIEFIAEQMMLTFSKLHSTRPSIALFTAVWLLHIAGTAHLENIFSDVARFVNQYGVAWSVISSPPSLIDLQSPDHWCSPNSENFVPIRDIGMLADLVRSSEFRSETPAEDIAFSLLNGQPQSEWTKNIIGLLWQK